MRTSKPRYVGETKDQLRQGFGVYNYQNKFFRYEGEWNKGKKHGHGKLVMNDGSFYEGEFDEGEISGSGVRKWTTTGNVYEGEFFRGELTGKGTMKYGNGAVYEGEWDANMRQGEGILTGSDDSVYRGSFYMNKKHGDGTEITKDGQVYEGGWVLGSKQGHGLMKYKDGSTYEGQWRADMFNGEGSYDHCSGVTYQGIWINGRPEIDSTMLKIEAESEIEVEQGQVFDLEIKCTTSEMEMSHETGRMLQITAGIRSAITIVSSASKTFVGLDNINEQEEDANLISTPFGFEVQLYPICITTEQQVQQQQSPHDRLQSGSLSSDSATVFVQGERQVVLTQNADQTTDTGQKKDQQHQNNLQTADEEEFANGTERSFEVSKVKFHNQTEERIFSYDESTDAGGQVFLGEESGDKISADETQGFVVRTIDGMITLAGLFLPPMSSLSSRGSMLRSSPESDGRLSVKGNKRTDTASVSSSTHLEKEKKKTKPEQQPYDAERSKDTKEKENRKKKEKKEEKPVEEKYCKPGDYVIIVKDVTKPPFLDTVLEPAYLHVKVVTKSKKTKSHTRK